ncbi:hypothetical protein DY000_02026811 [Brassica cretica]|uniref:Uncharacterized protein n=1 Tax=Brassica cretica TaxID=69181 RepID=A0ABQ7E8S7_BRACR|nr:hypothetical protein DY000_02026811 [Brassica cretica]
MIKFPSGLVTSQRPCDPVEKPLGLMTKTAGSRCESLSGLVERFRLVAASPKSKHFGV